MHHCLSVLLTLSATPFVSVTLFIPPPPPPPTLLYLVLADYEAHCTIDYVAMWRVSVNFKMMLLCKLA